MQRITRWISALVLIFAGLSGLGVLVAGQASASPSGVLLSGFPFTTAITNDGATAGFGPEYEVWAIDGPAGVGGGSFTRTTNVYSEPASTCTAEFSIPSLPAGASCFSETVADSGPFETVAGNYRPNQGATDFTKRTGDTIVNQVTGTFSGTAEYIFYVLSGTSVGTAYMASAVNDASTADLALPAVNQTAQWYLQSISGHTINPADAALLHTWKWKYVTDQCGETWTDSYGDGVTGGSGTGFNSYGESNPLTVDGNIAGLVPGNSGCSPDTVSVTNPGTQTTTTGSSVSLGISASATDGDSVTSYSATGLPAGTSINNAGVISGAPTTAETTTVTVTASDNDESGTTTFTWSVVAPSVLFTSGSAYGDEVNPFGNGFDVFQQHAVVGQPIVGWTATQHDPATHFLAETEGSNFRFEYAPNGIGTGLCISNPGNNALVLRGCNTGPWQQFSRSGAHIISAINGGIVNPNGKGAQLTVGSSATSWGGSNYTYELFAALPA